MSLRKSARGGKVPRNEQRRIPQGEEQPDGYLDAGEDGELTHPNLRLRLSLDCRLQSLQDPGRELRLLNSSCLMQLLNSSYTIQFIEFSNSAVSDRSWSDSSRPVCFWSDRCLFAKHSSSLKIHGSLMRITLSKY